jgi:hypothetical protein
MTPDPALVTLADETEWLNGWFAAATFEGEFSDAPAAKPERGVVRYV